MILIFSTDIATPSFTIIYETFVPYVANNTDRFEGILVAIKDKNQLPLKPSEAVTMFEIDENKDIDVILWEENYSNQLPKWLKYLGPTLNALTPKFVDRIWDYFNNKNPHRKLAKEYACYWQCPVPTSEPPINRHMIAIRSAKSWKKLIEKTGLDKFYMSADQGIATIAQWIKGYKALNCEKQQAIKKDIDDIVMMYRTPAYSDGRKKYDKKSWQHQQIAQKIFKIHEDYKDEKIAPNLLEEAIRHAFFADWGFQEYMLWVISRQPNVITFETREKVWPKTINALERLWGSFWQRQE